MRSPLPAGDHLGRAIVETVRAPLLVLNGELRVQAANPAFQRTFGLSESFLLGKPFFEADGGPWDDPRLRSLLQDVLPTRTELRDLKVRVELRRLGPRTLVVNARQIRLEGERMALLLLSLEDVTEREALAAEVARRNRELERSNRDLEDFAHVASHDLQEPLRKIRTYVHRLEARVAPDALDERSREYLERMGSAAARMQRRIDDVLQLARIGRSLPEVRRVDPGDVLRSVLEDLEPAVEEAHARVVVGELPLVEADPDQLRLMLQNLVANAVKFRRPGRPPTIRVGGEARPPPESEAGDGASRGALDTAPPRPDAPPPREIRIVVEDDGIGFDPQYAERILEPFQRLHGREVYEGSGIGLAICRRIMENHDGRILAEGRAGEGARFTLVFPQTREGGR